jgi:uncharacterized YccA/Bax inhibitor family protein
MKALFAAAFTLVVLCVIRMVWSVFATGLRENKASGVAAVVYSISQPRFLVFCLLACVAVYAITVKR